VVLVGLVGCRNFEERSAVCDVPLTTRPGGGVMMLIPVLVAQTQLRGVAPSTPYWPTFLGLYWPVR